MQKLTKKTAAPIAALSCVAAIAAIAAITDGAPIATLQTAPVEAPLWTMARLPDAAEDLGDIVIGDPGRQRLASDEAMMVQTGIADVDRVRFPKGLVIADNRLEIGSWARISNLSSGDNIAVRVIARPGEGSAAATILSGDVASELGFAGQGEQVAIMIEPLDKSPAASRLLASRAAYNLEAIETASVGGEIRAATANGVAPDRYLDIGLAESQTQAEALLERLRGASLADGRFGDAAIEPLDTADGARWRVSLGPVPGWSQAIQARNAAREAGFAGAELFRR